MSETTHATFSIEKIYKHPRAKVFAAFADPQKKQRWFAEGKDFSVDQYTNDFKVGGKETSRFRFKGGIEGGPPAGTAMGNDTVYLDIEADQRIVFAYVMLAGDHRMSASLATVELTDSGGGTRLVFTEQAAFFDKSDGPKLREDGWRGLLDKLGVSIG